MRQQLRVRIVLPVAVLGLLGAGFAAFASGKPPESIPVPPPTTSAASTTTDTTPTPPKKRKAKSPVQRVLDAHRITVLVFYTAGGGVDTAAVREARAGAVTTNAGFAALDVAKRGTSAKLASRFEVRGAPTVLVVVRGKRTAAHFDGYVDRETVAQAVVNARQ